LRGERARPPPALLEAVRKEVPMLATTAVRSRHRAGVRAAAAESAKPLWRRPIAVPIFGANYDRADSLARASKALGRGRRKQAIAEYRRVLEQEPGNPVILAKLAPLLAETKQLAEAGATWSAAGKQYENQGFPEKALASIRRRRNTPRRSRCGDDVGLKASARGADCWRCPRSGALRRRKGGAAIAPAVRTSPGISRRRSTSRVSSRSRAAAPRRIACTRVCASTSAAYTCAACAGRCSGADRRQLRSGAGSATLRGR
jgi:hypothetical protein